jgi:hypothetical protein
MATKNNVTYKMQVFSFDWTHPGYSTPVTTHTSMTDVQNMTTSNIPDLDSTTDFWYANGKPTSSTNINDKATEFNNMLTAMNSTMPNPGDGTTTAKPQEVLFIITDGVTDEQIGSSRWNRELTTAHLNNCTTIKNRGIKIANPLHGIPARCADRGFLGRNPMSPLSGQRAAGAPEVRLRSARRHAAGLYGIDRPEHFRRADRAVRADHPERAPGEIIRPIRAAFAACEKQRSPVHRAGVAPQGNRSTTGIGQSPDSASGFGL